MSYSKIPSSPSLSVIIPVLNNKLGLDKAIKSVLSQPYLVELIIIDGGSVDGTLEIIKKYYNEISYWESGKDSGISNAFNRGIIQATGELVAILNSDDFWEPDTLDSIFKIAINNPDADIFHGKLRFLDGKSGGHYILTSTLNGIERRMTLFHPSTFIRKSAYEKVGLYDENYSYAMDSEWFHRAIKHKLVFVAVSSILANMSLGGASDVSFVKSLAEYRKSLIKHGLQSPIKAWMYFVFFTLGKTIMLVSSFSHIYRKLKRWVKN